jgi:dienelactone hydrolase
MTKARWWRFIFGVALANLVGVSGASALEPVAVPVQYKGHDIELPGRFDKPAGAGPFPAVILLHGCHGYTAHLPHLSAWSALLLGEGYATLILDSFTPRGGYTCNGVPASTRALDVVAAATFLANRRDIRADKIAVMGFSHGGGTALDAAVMMSEWRTGVPRSPLVNANADSFGAAYVDELERQFKTAADQLASLGRIAAYIAFYPHTCRAVQGDHFAGPVLILIGTYDEEVSYPNCNKLAAMQQRGGPEFRFKAYASASHSFDWDVGDTAANRRPGLAQPNASAAADARAEVRNFLQRYLKSN